jgi:DNA-directed RNA polymerase subunit RPC12/RpoP
VVGLPVNALDWIIGGICLAIALDCILGKVVFRPLLWLAWLATCFLVYRLGLDCGGSHSLTGFLGGLQRAFAFSARTANILLQAAWAYLLVGSFATLLWLRRQQKQEGNQLKMICPACGGHIQFLREKLNQKVPCPHCQASITLQQPGNLKMSCFFCHEHIEFPAHAVGQKLKCPHCNNDITLKDATTI